MDILNFLADADQAYHNGDKPLVSDEVYDALRKQVPELKTVGAPVEFTPFKKTTHSERLRSLDNVFNSEELIAWVSSLNLVKGAVCEYKLDGLALVLTYSNRQLVRAVTRGDGNVGDDVTHLAIYIHNVPRLLPAEFSPEEFEVHGEAFMLRSTLEIVNAQLKLEGKAPLANPRNAAAGVLRSKSADGIHLRPLHFMPYGFNTAFELLHQVDNYMDAMRIMEYGFDRSMINSIYSVSVEGVDKLYHEYQTNREALDFDIDGMVVKANSFIERRHLGVTTRAPNWAIAAKFPPVEVVSTLEGIDWTVGRTGIITPVARLTPVQVGGVMVSNCTLHNYEQIQQLNLNTGSLVVVSRRGDVIPKIETCLDPVKCIPYPRPETCPCCGSALIHKPPLMYCANESKCEEVKIARLVYFVSRGVMDLRGIGPAMCDYLIRNDLVDNPYDLLCLPYTAFQDICSVFGELNTNKIIANINSRLESITLDRFILGLCIDGIGESTAKIIADYYVTLEALVADVKGVLDSVHDTVAISGLSSIGPILTEQFIVGIKQHWTLIEDVLNYTQYRMDSEYPIYVQPQVVDQCEPTLSGNTYVITGSFNIGSRDMIKDELTKRGAKVSGSVSAKTTALICGENAGSKLDNALRLNVPVIREAELTTLIQYFE